MTIRRAKPDEFKQLSELAYCSKAHWGYSDEFMTACRAELTYAAENIREGLFYVLVNDNTLTGFYSLVNSSDTKCELEALFIKPGFIGRGYGLLLIDHARQMAKAQGAAELIIQSDPNAADFYIKAGAQRVGERESASIADRYLPLFSIKLIE